MVLKKLPHGKIDSLLREHLSMEEGAETAALIRELRQARVRRYLTPSELEKVCRWKSARAIRHITSNSATRIRRATRRALATRSERQRLEALMTLNGVSIPMASAILMLLNPQRLLALLQHLAGDAAGAKASAEQARNTLEPLHKDQQDNALFAANLSQNYAVLGNKELALKEAERAVTLLPRAKDLMTGPAAVSSLILACHLGAPPVAICQRWRTILCDRISNGIRIFSQILRSLLVDLSRLVARSVSIHPRKQRSASMDQLAIHVQFGSRALSPIEQ
jgi:hypothetical protein